MTDSIAFTEISAEHEAKKRERARARKMPGAAIEDDKKTTRISTGGNTPVAAIGSLPVQQDDMMTSAQQDNTIGQELRDPSFGNDMSIDQGFRELLAVAPNDRVPQAESP